MNKKNNVKRYLAALLTVIMIFQQSGVNAIFASSENIPAAATTEEEVAAQAEEAEEEPEEEEVEEPQEPTESPEPEQPEDLQDPEEPKEPEQPQETITPEATPEATPEVTETPEETTTPTPEVTEAPEETPKTNFTYEDSRVSITAEAEEGANLPQDAELKADYLDPNGDAYKAAVEEFNVQLGNDDTIADYVLYDIYFLSESKNGRIEPEDGNVTVSVTFKTPEVIENKDKIVDSQIVHLDDENKAEVVSGNVDISADGTVQSMTFTNDSFSPYGFRLAYAKQVAPVVESNEYFMTLEEAKNTTVKLGMTDTIRNAIQNSKIEIQCTYYDKDQNKLTGINPDKLRDIQIGSMSGGRYLGNDIQNVDSRVAYVKITMLENELKNTFFTFSKNAPVKDGNDLTFNIEKRTFQPDEVWEVNGLTYIAVGPEHQYNVSGPLGLINNFHAVGFTKVNNSVHTNGNILTKELNYGSNFGTNQVSNEISYIESFTNINDGMICGATNEDILVVGSSITVTCDGQNFYLNGHKLDKPKTIYQDTQQYKFLDMSSLKTEAVQLSQDMAGQADQGVTKSENKIIISENYSGTAVVNITLEDLQSHTQIEGLSNNAGTSLILNVKVSGDSVTIPQLSLNSMNNTGGEQGDFSAGKLIWNILNQDGTPYTGTVYQNKATTGTILVPNGTFTTAANWNGSMIANEVNINAESHRTDFTGTMGFGIEKFVEKDGSDAWKTNYKFQFELSAPSGTPMPRGAKSNSEGDVAKGIEASYGNRTPSFGLITYTESDIGKTYEYTLKELVGNSEPGITYSKVVYKIKVEVQSNEGVGLSIIRSYSSDEGKTWTNGLPKGNRFVFTNTFNNNNRGNLTITKEVVGEADDFEGTFYFTVTQGNKYSSYKYYDLNGNVSSGKKVLALKYKNKAGSITLNNLAAGTYVVTEVADSKGTAIKKAPKFPYTVSKISKEIEVTAGDTADYIVTNTKGEQEEKTKVTVTKAWSDNNDQDGKRPQDIKVQLYAGKDKFGEEVTLNTGNNWSYIWTGLDVKKAGTVISYSVKEVNVPEGYTSTVSGDAKNGFTITNSHTPETTQVSGTKTWNDSNDQDGKRPGSITVNLLANGTKVDSKTVTEKDGWKYSFTNLPKYENGKEITYTITEDAVADYSTEVKGYNITNSYTPGKTSVTVTKAWVDNDNKSGKRPSEIKVQLYADGKESGSPVTLNEANKWTYTWSGLDEKRSGSTIVYTVKEVGTVDGYETSVSGDARTGYTITNTLKSGTLEIVKSITGAISDSILTADQKAAMTFTVTGPDGYSQTVHYSDFTDGKYTFSNLPLGDYTVTETNADIEGYKLTTTYSVDGGKATVTSKKTATVTITNDYTTTKKTSVKISKVDSSTYEVLGGAHLMIIDPDGKVVDEWDSTKKAHKITDLKPGVTYTLRETVAPKGYDVTADTTFELNEDGTFNTANTTTTISDDTLFVVDEKTVNKDINVSVTKRLVTVDGTVIGALDATYYVALYSDPDCTQRVSDVKALNYKNASSSTVTFTGLKEGQTYYVGECETDGTSYLANVNADGTMYTVDFSNGNTVEVKNSDGSTTVYFDNQFEKIPDGFYKEGELNITKKLVGGDGKAKNSSEIFYAGIFSDEDFTQLSPDVSENIVPLDLAGGSEATSQVKVSIPESGSITLYVTEVDSKGNPVAGAASFKYDVSVDNAQVTFDDDNISADVIITNTEDTPEITPTPGTPNTPNTPNNGTSRKAGVKTGDSTPIGMFVGLFAAAAIIAGAAVFFKRRKK